ncbi:MAG: UbiA family prenyltransferase [candidate division NC10 bacterium]|nr:UbiA family prenyltransferase [candidate division NC10 bacterium]
METRGRPLETGEWGLAAALKKITLFWEFIKFPHTIFALPFAFMGAILAARGLPTGRQAFWILMAMVGARSGAMAFNRLADRRLDALNFRTRDRALPKGLLTVGEALLFTFASFGLFLFASYQLNPLCLKLSPLAILIVTLYSYTKRFTASTHFFLGLALACAPIGAWIAVKGAFALPPFLLGLAVLFWVAGFDILYALADIEFDRTVGLHSIPARLGPEKGIVVSRLLHLLTFTLLALLLPLAGLGPLYLIGLALAGGLLFYEHLLLAWYGLAKLDAAFFMTNGLLSVALFVFTFLDVVL